jgi:uncharacterized protein YecT (DUF1311 family)
MKRCCYLPSFYLHGVLGASMIAIPAQIFFVCLLSLASVSNAMAQYSDQSRRQIVQAQWERLSPKELLCVDSRLRRARRSVNALIDQGISPTETRVARIVRDCSPYAAPDKDTVTPTFDCRAATYSDEKTICVNSELALLDRTVVEAYEDVLARKGSRIAKNISEPLLEQRHACETNVECIKQIQQTAIAAFQARGAPVQPPVPAAVGTAAAPVYAVDDIRLGSVVGNPELRDFDCVASSQYPGLTACRRQTTERTRRRRMSVSTSLLHAADGSVVYIGQSIEPVSIGNATADEEIARLSETLGKTTLLPMQDSRSGRNGIVASWGAVSLQPLEPERLTALAAGSDDKSDLLIDHIGDPQRSAQLGLPVYRLNGGPGYVWAASSGRRGRGSLRMIAIDASRLPGSVATTASSPPVQTVAAAAQDGKDALVETPMKAADPSPPKANSMEPPTITAPQAEAPAPVRVVGPPIELRPATPTMAATSTPTPLTPTGATGFAVALTSTIIALLGISAYLYGTSKMRRSVASGITGTTAQRTQASVAIATRLTKTDAVATPEADKIDLPTLAPIKSPVTIAAPPTDMAASSAAQSGINVKKQSPG